MAEWLGRRTINQKVVGSIPGRAKWRVLGQSTSPYLLRGEHSCTYCKSLWIRASAKWWNVTEWQGKKGRQKTLAHPLRRELRQQSQKTPKGEKTAKQLLGELYSDKEYLEKLLKDEGKPRPVGPMCFSLCYTNHTPPHSLVDNVLPLFYQPLLHEWYFWPSTETLRNFVSYLLPILIKEEGYLAMLHF